MLNYLHGIIEITFQKKNYKGEWEEDDKLKKKEGLSTGKLQGKSSTGELQFAPTAPTAPTDLIKNLDFKIWQRNYYEHITRNGKAYHRIAEYIMNNPKNTTKANSRNCLFFMRPV